MNPFIVNDVQLNLRNGEELRTSLELYKNMNTFKIDTTNISISEAVDKIICEVNIFEESKNF